MNFGQVGRELLLELKRSEWLPLYSEDAVSRCILVRACVRGRGRLASSLSLTDAGGSCA